jgi:hypothetical protein
MSKKRAKSETLPAAAPTKLLSELRGLIEAARSTVAQAVNSALVLL